MGKDNESGQDKKIKSGLFALAHIVCYDHTMYG